MLDAAQQFFADHGTLLKWTAIASGVLLVLSLVSLPVCAVLMPQDFLTRPIKRRGRAAGEASRPALRVALRVLKNFAGVLLAIAGVLMLALPGQGLLTIMLAVVLLDIPGKQRLQRRVLSSSRVLRMLNRTRQRFGRPPLDPPRQVRFGSASPTPQASP